MILTEQDETDIREHMGAIYRAFLTRDVEALQRLLADEFTFCDPSGMQIATKEQWLRDIGSGELTFHSIAPGNVDIDTSGDTVRVRGNATLSTRYPRSNYNGTFRYIGVYTRRDGQWQLLLTSAQRLSGA